MALALIVLASGCITIEEHYNFKKNGSGTMEYVVDMSELAGLMEGMATGGKKEKSPAQGGMSSGMDERAEALKALKGVKRVKYKDEKDGYLQRISFQFADIDALNRALNVLMPDSTGKEQRFFHWEGNTLVRANNHYAKELGGDMAGDADSTDLSGILESMKYKYSFKFAKKLEGVQRADGMVEDSRADKQVELSTDWSAIMKDPAALDLRIAVHP